LVDGIEPKEKREGGIGFLKEGRLGRGYMRGVRGGRGIWR